MWSRKQARNNIARADKPAREPAAHAAGPDVPRRTFLSRLGFGALLAALAGQAFALLRSLVPNALYERSSRFKIGNDRLEIANPCAECSFLFCIKSGRKRLTEKSPDFFECEERFECFLDSDTHDISKPRPGIEPGYADLQSAA